MITINKGRDGHRDRLLEGLTRNTWPHECVVVEIGSCAETRRCGNIRHVPLPDLGLPLALARNTGRMHATGKVLIFLDVDCIPSSDLVTVLADAAVSGGGLVCCQVVYLPKMRVGDGWAEADLRARGVTHPARRFPSEGLVAAPDPGLFWSLAFGVTASTFDSLGGFDTTFSGYGAEDTDLAFRAQGMGVPIHFSSSSRAYHQWHDAYDPPLQHCADIVRNAAVFRQRHGFWPMPEWLDAFARLGLVSMAGDRLELLRLPTLAEIDAARIAPERPF